MKVFYSIYRSSGMIIRAIFVTPILESSASSSKEYPICNPPVEVLSPPSSPGSVTEEGRSSVPVEDLLKRKQDYLEATIQKLTKKGQLAQTGNKIRTRRQHRVWKANHPLPVVPHPKILN